MKITNQPGLGDVDDLKVDGKKPYLIVFVSDKGVDYKVEDFVWFNKCEDIYVLKGAVTNPFKSAFCAYMSFSHYPAVITNNAPTVQAETLYDPSTGEDQSLEMSKLVNEYKKNSIILLYEKIEEQPLKV